MFYCERCGTRFNAGAAPSALVCPRCRGKDGVVSPLTFKILDSPVVRKLGHGSQPGTKPPGVSSA